MQAKFKHTPEGKKLKIGILKNGRYLMYLFISLNIGGAILFGVLAFIDIVKKVKNDDKTGSIKYGSGLFKLGRYR